MIIIYISGIDGCGKTTQSLLLEKELRSRGVSVKYAWLRWDPSFRKLFDLLRLIIGKIRTNRNFSAIHQEQLHHNRWILFKKSVLSKRLFQRLWWRYASMDYLYALKKKIGDLSTYDVIIVDRYIQDFVIDQAINLGVSSQDQFSIIEKLKAKSFRFPDYTIIINLPAEVGYRRKSDGTPLDYLKERESRYRLIPHDHRTLHLNGLESIDLLAHSILTWVTHSTSIQNTMN